MAMCMSLIAAGGVPVEIRDPNCVRKHSPITLNVWPALWRNNESS